MWPIQIDINKFYLTCHNVNDMKENVLRSLLTYSLWLNVFYSNGNIGPYLDIGKLTS